MIEAYDFSGNTVNVAVPKITEDNSSQDVVAPDIGITTPAGPVVLDS